MHTINILLYAFGFIFNGATYLGTKDPSKYFLSGFQRGSTYLVLLCQSLFGVAVSAVYKFSDATVKTFALSCATSILMFINIVAFGARFSLVATMGCLTVFVATHLYISNPPGLKGVSGSIVTPAITTVSASTTCEERTRPRWWLQPRNQTPSKVMMATGKAFTFFIVVLICFWDVSFHVAPILLRQEEQVPQHHPNFSRHCLLMAGSIRDMGSYLHLINQTWISAQTPDLYAVLGTEFDPQEAETRQQRPDGLLPHEAEAVEQLRSLPFTRAVVLQDIKRPSGELGPELLALVPSFPFLSAPPAKNQKKRLGYIHQWLKWGQVWKLMENITKSWNHTYDMVVKIRPDIKYFPELGLIDLDALADGRLGNHSVDFACSDTPSNIMPQQELLEASHNKRVRRLFFPNCCFSGGLNDQLFWGEYSTMRYAMNTLSRVESLFGENQTKNAFAAKETFRDAVLDYVSIEESIRNPLAPPIGNCLEVHKMTLRYCLGVNSKRWRPTECSEPIPVGHRMNAK
jgi:hypothetical protein